MRHRPPDNRTETEAERRRGNNDGHRFASALQRDIPGDENDPQTRRGRRSDRLQQAGGQYAVEMMRQQADDGGDAEQHKADYQERPNRDEVGQTAIRNGRNGKQDRVAGDDPRSGRSGQSQIMGYGRQRDVEHGRVHDDQQDGETPEWDN